MRGWSLSTCFFALLVLLAAADTRAQDTGGRFLGDRVVRCESKGGQAHLCPVDVRGGVRILRTLSKSECDENRTWGVLGAGIWVRDGCRAEFVLGYGGSVGSAYGERTVRCESRGSRWQHCDSDTSAGVELVRQLSKNPCIKGDNWGADNRGVWVSGGCRAEFRMMAIVAAEPSEGKIVRCDSTDKLPRHCPAVTEGGAVRLFRQLSRAACIEGRSWGVDKNGIWVEDGCRAEFEVRHKEDLSGG
ncbi:DUF3011 domain-containing protein [Lysobacter sp. GCM10012299]|uniref:DUF3011 domain-containing protein n=1 Tax=Lysobacter sp. GCM10012299 TaxID=3317333 RepID=UPI00361EF917